MMVRPGPRWRFPLRLPPPRSAEERIALAKTLTTLVFLIPASIILTVDWFVSRRLSWSLFVLVSLGAAWMWSILPLIFIRLPYLLIGSVTAVAVALEWGLGLLAGNIGWVLTVGMPIVVIAGAVSSLIVLFSRISSRLGGNLAGWILISIGILSVCTDILINAHYLGTWKPGWSLIVGATVLPVAALLMYLHYRPSQQSRIRRYFHV